MNEVSYWFAREAAMYVRDVAHALSEIAYAKQAGDVEEITYWQCVATRYECENVLHNAASSYFYTL